jgi:uncharacterized phage protein gp47/JayE
MSAQTFDSTLSSILTDIINNCPGADVTEGSPLYAQSCALASAVWGCLQKIEYNKKQIFPDTSTSAILERHCYIYGITRETDETDAALLTRLLARVQQAPAGGNAHDYETWALSVIGVAQAKCISCPQGAGTVDIVILADEDMTGSETPSSTLIASVYAYIDTLRPVTAGTFRVLAAQIIQQNVTMVVGSSYAAAVLADLTTLMSGLSIAATFYLSAAIQLALQDGATDAQISLPTSNVVPTEYQVIRPGTITVS